MNKSDSRKTRRYWRCVFVLFACFLCRCRCWTGVRSRRQVGLTPWFASAAALQTCYPASCTSSTKATSAATRKAHTSWSSWWRTRPHHARARRSSPLRWTWKKAPQAAATPTPGVLMTLNPWSLDPRARKEAESVAFTDVFLPSQGFSFFSETRDALIPNRCTHWGE